MWRALEAVLRGGDGDVYVAERGGEEGEGGEEGLVGEKGGRKREGGSRSKERALDSYIMHGSGLWIVGCGLWVDNSPTMIPAVTNVASRSH